MDIEKIYSKLPMPAQNLACSLEGWRVKKQRFNSTFFEVQKRVEERGAWGEEAVIQFRDKRLREFVAYCYLNTEFYKKLLDNNGISPNDIQCLNDLKNLPILTKEVVKQSYSELIPKIQGKETPVEFHTSGTTGSGLKFLVSQSAIRERYAVWWRYRGWHGLSMDEWHAYFGGRSVVSLRQQVPPYWRFNYPGKQFLFSAYHMNDEALPHYVDFLNKKKVEWFHGYPSLLTLVANYMNEHGLSFEHEVKWVSIGAESLLPSQITAMEQAFQVRPIQHYSLAEGCVNISECEEGSLHVDEDYAAVEFLPIDDVGTHKVIGTSFSNFATPLIRYDTNDLVTLIPNATCSCGRAGRIVASINGRREDYVVLKNGARLGRLDHIFKDMVHVKEAQVHQSRAGELNVRIVPLKSFKKENEAELLQEFRKRVGDLADIHIQYVERIPRTKSGKLRFVVSDIPAEQF